VRSFWIGFGLLVSLAAGCEAVASFDRGKIGQPSAPPATIRRDAGPKPPDAGELDAADDEEEPPPVPMEDAEADIDAPADVDADTEPDAGDLEDASADGAPDDADVSDGTIEVLDDASGG
jgi:hypothetical protein